MPRIYTPSLNIGPGKRVGTDYGASGVTDSDPNMIRGLGRNDRSQPYRGTTTPTNLYFDIFDSSEASQTFRHAFILTENVSTIEIRTTASSSFIGANLYTPGPMQGIRLNNGTGKESGTHRNVFNIQFPSGESGRGVELRIQSREDASHPFYVYAVYFMNDMLLELKNDDQTQFSSYRITTQPRNGTLQVDLYGTESYQHAVNMSDKRQVQFTVWRLDDQLILIDRWLDNIIRTRQQYSNIVLEEGFITGEGPTFNLTAEAHNIENVYPATWSTAVNEQIEGTGAKSMGFRFQQS